MGPVNDGLRFLLELCGLAAVGYWGFADHEGALRWLLGIGAPVALAVVWAVFVNPQGSAATSDPVRFLLELAVFGSAVGALVAAGEQRLGLALAAVVAVHLALTFPLDQR